MSTRNVDVKAAFLQVGDTIVHPLTMEEAVIARIDHYLATGKREFFFTNGKLPRCEWKASSKVTLAVQSSTSK